MVKRDKRPKNHLLWGFTNARLIYIKAACADYAGRDTLAQRASYPPLGFIDAGALNEIESGLWL
jgi:hypothetical protein